MKWFSWGKKQIEKKSNTTTIPIAPGSFVHYLLAGGGPVTAHQAMVFYRENAAIATAVDLIADSFNQIQPVLETTDSKGLISFDNGHEVIQKLKHPNEFQNWKEYAGDVSRHYLLTHNSLISMLGSFRREPTLIYSIKPQNVSVIENFLDGFPDRYIISKGAGHGSYTRNITKGVVNFFDGSVKEIYHIMGFSSRTNNIWADSPLEAAALDAKQQIEGRVHNLQLIKQGGRLSLIVNFKDNEPMDDDEHQARKKRINEDLAGSSNAGKIAVISGTEVGIDEVGTTNKDMDYATLDQTAAFTIYNRYRIPLPLITTTAAKFNNMQMAVEQLYDFAVLPLADVIFAGLTRSLFDRFNLDINSQRLTYNPESITALKKRRLDELEQRRKMNLETTDELRADMAREPLKEGGDVLYQPTNLVPVGTDMFTEDNEPEEEARKLLERDGLS
jgi:HK97 family phage portal protein